MLLGAGVVVLIQPLLNLVSTLTLRTTTTAFLAIKQAVWMLFRVVEWGLVIAAIVALAKTDAGPVDPTRYG